jgi:hypothetical protein
MLLSDGGIPAMNRKLWRLAASLLPMCFLPAQPACPQDSPAQANGEVFRQPSPEALRQMAEMRQRVQANANAINDLASSVKSIEDAHKLIDLVAAEFSHELPPKWATRSIRDRVARAEFESAGDPGGLIPEQHVADVWNDYLEKIGAPQESFITAAEIHTLRDTNYVNSQLFWARGNQTIWTVPNIYAVGPDGKVANGCRALEALNILWQLANQPGLLPGTRELIKKGQLWSDMYKSPSKPPAPEPVKGFVTFSSRIAPPNPVQQAALQYMNDHGAHALNSAIKGLLEDLFAG